MELRPDTLTMDQRYKLLTGLVVPRPIAWVSTVDAAGLANLAPFSYFSIVGHEPMSIVFSVAGRKPGGADKDTLCNARLTSESGAGEFVVSVVSTAQVEAMAGTAAPVGRDVSEFSACAVPSAPSSVVRAPRVADAPASFECRTLQVVTVGVANLVIGEVVCIHLKEGLLDWRGRVRFDRLDAVGRLAGGAYVTTRERFEIIDEKFFPQSRPQAEVYP